MAWWNLGFKSPWLQINERKGLTEITVSPFACAEFLNRPGELGEGKGIFASAEQVLALSEAVCRLEQHTPQIAASCGCGSTRS